MKMFEEWFWNKNEPQPVKKEKLTHIEEVQEEENISKEEIQNAVNLFFNYEKKVKFYLNAFKSHKEDIYFDKFIKFYHKIVEQLYRLWKIKDEINLENFNFDKEFKKVSNAYDGTTLVGENLAGLMKDVTLWLNIMDIRSEDEDVYYCDSETIRDQRGFFRYKRCKYKNRIKEEKKKEEHKEVDPFGEEEWKDENK
jgi:hypothetical protein